MSAATSRNAPCGCGSGRRHKQCCGQLAATSITPARPIAEIPPDAMALLGQALASGRWHDAERIARALLDHRPGTGELWRALAVAQTRQGHDGIEAWRSAVQCLPADAASHNNLANAFARVGRVDEAIDHWRRAGAIQPNLVEAHLNLGDALQSQERPDEALAAFRRTLAVDPSRLEALLGVGAVCLTNGRLEEAADAYRQAQAAQPRSAEIFVNLGSAVRGLGRVEEAIDLFRQAIDLNPGLTEAHAALGTAFRLQGLAEEAEACLGEALRLRPDLVSAILAFAEARADQGDFAGAEDQLRRAITISSDSPEAWAGIPRVRHMTADDVEWFDGAQRVIAKAPPPRQRLHLHYALGKYHDDLGQYAEAFANFEQANLLASACRPPHDRAALSRTVRNIVETYDSRWLASSSGQGDPSPVPVFIVGMLRSGTTLLEQMLAAHPDADGAGELSFWGEAAARRRGNSATAEPLGALARAYLDQLQATRGHSLRVVDKMPANLMHLGLIHAALPNARIIHLRRDPIDTCLSIYFQHFEPTLTYANDLGDLADYHRRCDQVMAHWRQILPEGAILEVDYEALVADPRTTLQNILRFVDLPWNDLCLDFHKLRRVVITASKWQSRQKIHTGSVGRWRRYEAFIEPLLSLGSAEQSARLQTSAPPPSGRG
jgi:tetratricopeptide (TPR) repeat protein